jgi:hypothetical protein
MEHYFDPYTISKTSSSICIDKICIEEELEVANFHSYFYSTNFMVMFCIIEV